MLQSEVPRFQQLQLFVDKVTGRRTKLAGARYFVLYSKASRPAVGPASLPFNGYWSVLLQEQRDRDV